MTYAVRGLMLPFCLALISTIPAFAQTSSSAAPTVVAPAPVANLYVVTAKGINLYNASPTGQLSLVSGSPFQASGLLLGKSGNYFISEGTEYIHSYKLTSTGGIGAQVSQINSALYEGGDCGSTYGGTIDRTGNEIYIQTQGAEGDDGSQGVCDGLQTFKINASTGQLTYAGATLFYSDRYDGIRSSPMLAGNNGHAFTIAPQYYGCDNVFKGFYRDANGLMNAAGFNEVDYNGSDPNGAINPQLLASDNLNASVSHMAVGSVADIGAPCGTPGTPVLTTYTIDYKGNITDNQSLTYPDVTLTTMQINPQGNLLAVGGNVDNPTSTVVLTGLEVFHFNGANPIARYSSVLTSAPIDSVAWDKSNHLYALSKSTNKLYVYTITPTSITPVSGSPYTMASPTQLTVVSR